MSLGWFLIILWIILVRYSYCIYRGYNNFNKKTRTCLNCTRMDFKQWKQFYYVNPNRYNINMESDNLRYNHDSTDEPFHLKFSNVDAPNRFSGYSNYYSQCIQITFSFFDYIRFLFFVAELRASIKKHNRTKIDITNNKNLRTILETTQNDIQKLREESEKEIKIAEELTEEFIKKGEVSSSLFDAIKEELAKEMPYLNSDELEFLTRNRIKATPTWQVKERENYGN